MKRKKISVFVSKMLIIVFSCLIAPKLYSQTELNIEVLTDSLVIFGRKIINENQDDDKFNANNNFKKILVQLLNSDNAIDIDFSKVDNLSVMQASDNSFRLFSWTIPKSDGTFAFEGIVYSRNNKLKRYLIYELNDIKHTSSGIALKTLKNNEWYGALYYQLIETKGNSKMYTLLGWDGNNSLSTKKVIDVLTLQSDGTPIFGAEIFSGYGKHIKRVIFEHSATTQMTLKYEKQAYIIKKQSLLRTKKNKDNSRISVQFNDGFRAQKADNKTNVKHKRKYAMMIVFDRLIPTDDSMKEMYQFYVPAINIIDGFVFLNKHWIYTPDIDARNPKAPLDNFSPASKQKSSKIPSLNMQE